MVLPSEPGERVATIDDIYVFYVSYLGRQPNYATEALPRVGQTYLSQEVAIRCSQEAANYRANHGAEPDTWCFTRDPVTGKTIPGVPLPPVVSVPVPTAPPPTTGIPGLDALIAKIWQPIADILARVNAVKTALGDNIGKTLEPILREVAATGGRITQTLADNITALIPRALELAAEAADNASAVAAGFLENAASVGDLMGGAAEAIGLHRDDIWKFVTDALGAGFGGGIAAWLGDVEDQHTDNLNPILQAIQSTDTIPGWVKNALGLQAGVTNPLALIVGVSLLMSVAGQFAVAILGPEIANTTYKNNELRTVLLINAQQAATAAAQGLRDQGALANIAQRNGFNADQFGVLTDLARTFPPANTVTAAALRGAIDPFTEDKLLTRLGLNDEGKDVWRAMALQLPGVQDTIRMAVREVFNPPLRTELTLDAEYPQALTGHARAIGLSEEWARNFWAAHWELPGPNQVYEMLHRGMITPKQLDDYLKAADYAPVWRDRLRDIAFNVFTRVDIRRIHDLRGKDRDWLVAQHKRLGYNDEDANELSDFVELLNDDERGARNKELTGPLVGRIITNVVNGTLNEAQAGEFFSSLGYRQDAIDTFLIEARLIGNEQRTEKVANLIGDLYVKDRRTELEATDQLRERGFTQGEIETRFREWKLEKELRAPTEREEKERDLTRADIEAMYRARQLPRDQATVMLTALRYSALEVKAILDLADYREKVNEDKDRVEVVHRKFVKGTFTKTQSEQTLGQIGLRATQIEASIARWELEISAKTADLSVGQVGEVYKLGHWDDVKTRGYLARIGYDEDEISALLRLWGSKVEEQRRRDELAAQRAEETRRREAERVLLAASRKEKDLAKTDLLNAGAAGVLRWDEVKLALMSAGYSPYEADVLIRTKQTSGGKKLA